MDGILTCAKYAFAPNYYKYCGPDANKNICAYLREGNADPGLTGYLREFAVLFPYLKLIAEENGIADPFDPRVVEAYWIGNDLLDKVGMRAFADHLLYKQQLKKKISPKNLKWIMEKVPGEAKIHHSFHVFSIFTRTGHREVAHTLDTMNECRIGWGKVIKIPETSYKKQVTNNKKQIKGKRQGGLRVETQKLVYVEGKLQLKNGIERELSLPVDNPKNEYRVGDYVSFHWGFVCEVISKRQAERLSFYTRHNLKLANETI